MKKTTIVLCLIFLVSSILSGCQGITNDAAKNDNAADTNNLTNTDSAQIDEAIIGLWALTNAEIDDITLDEDTTTSFGEFTFDFKTDSTVTINAAGTIGDLKYISSDNNIEITDGTSTVITLAKNGDTLIFNQNGVNLIFTK